MPTLFDGPDENGPDENGHGDVAHDRRAGRGRTPSHAFSPSSDSPSLWLRVQRMIRLALFLALMALAALGFVYYKSQQEPEFYETAMRQTPEATKAQGAELETRVMDLYNAALQFGPWRGEIHQDQINGWLASELPAKFPEILNRKIIADPRVSVLPGSINIAARANYGSLKSIVIASLDVFRTDQEDQFAVRVRSLRAGIVPIPIQTFAQEIENTLRSKGFQTRWSEIDGDPVLTVDVPQDWLVLQDLYKIEVETIDFHDQRIIVSGATLNQIERELQDNQ